MLNVDDKRNFYRMMVNKEVNVTILDDEANSSTIATCRDLSATGMAIELQHPIELGTGIRVKVDSGTVNVPALDAQGKVVRCFEESEESFLIGIEITDFD